MRALSMEGGGGFQPVACEQWRGSASMKMETLVSLIGGCSISSPHCTEDR